MTRSVRLSLQAAVSAGLVGLLLWCMPEGALAGLAEAAPGWVLAALFAYLAGQMVSGLRFFFLVAPVLAQASPRLGKETATVPSEAQKRSVAAPCGTSGSGEPAERTPASPEDSGPRGALTPWLAVRATILGTFAGTFLPVNVGGDVIKLAWLARRLGGDCAPAVLAGMVVERLSGVLVTLLFCGAVGAALSLEWTSGALPGRAVWLAAVAAGLMGVGALLFLRRCAAPWALRARDLLCRALDALRWWRDHPARIGGCLLLSLVNLLCGALVVLALGAAVGRDLTPLQGLAAIGLTTLTTYLPISISGLGVMEAGLAGLLVFFAYPPAAAVQVAVLLRLVSVAAALPGAFFWRSR